MRDQWITLEKTDNMKYYGYYGKYKVHLCEKFDNFYLIISWLIIRKLIIEF